MADMSPHGDTPPANELGTIKMPVRVVYGDPWPFGFRDAEDNFVPPDTIAAALNGRDPDADKLRQQALGEIGRLSAQLSAMRKALRKLAIKQHVRASSGGTYIPNGGSCELCRSEWAVEEFERHKPGCLAFPPTTKERGEAEGLNENERHAIAHAKRLVGRATDEKPDVCFDYEVVKALLAVIERGRTTPPAATPDAGQITDGELINFVEMCRQSRAGIKQESHDYNFDNSPSACVRALRELFNRHPQATPDAQIAALRAALIEERVDNIRRSEHISHCPEFDETRAMVHAELQDRLARIDAVLSTEQPAGTGREAAADAAMNEIWKQWFTFYTNHFRGVHPISAADQLAFYEIAQPILRALTASSREG